ncbi:hypothetical protein CSUI_007561, partial [Cystoisospora suis]
GTLPHYLEVGASPASSSSHRSFDAERMTMARNQTSDDRILKPDRQQKETRTPLTAPKRGAATKTSCFEGRRPETVHQLLSYPTAPSSLVCCARRCFSL